MGEAVVGFIIICLILATVIGFLAVISSRPPGGGGPGR